jgi:hypothetical protein
MSYTVWMELADSERECFMSGIPTEYLARRIATNLENEGFVIRAWVE